MHHKDCTSYGKDHKSIPKTAPRSTIFRKFVKWYKEIIFISYDTPDAKHYFRSTKLIQEEKMHQYNSKYWFCIHPFSKFQKYWQIIMCLTWVATFIHDIYLITFRRRTARTIYYGKQSAAAQWRNVILFLNYILLLHMLVCFLTGYVDKNTQKVIMVPKKIIKRYLKTWFCIDILTLYIIVKISVFSLTRMLRTAPGFDLIEVLRYIRLFRLITIFEYLKNTSKYTNMSYRHFLVFWYAFFIILVIHFNACLYYLIIDGINQAYPDNANLTWIYKLENYYKSKRVPLDSLSVYFHCTMELLLKFNRGGDNHIIRPQTFVENLCQLMFALMGFAFQVFLLAGFYHFFAVNDQSEITNDKKMKLLQNFLFHKKLPKKVVNDVITYAEIRKHIVFIKLKYLTPILNTETVYHFWKNQITDFNIFHALDAKILYEITNRMHPDVFLPNQIIYKFGDDVDKFYGISFGSVAVYAEDGLEVMHLKDDDYFGVGLTGNDSKRKETVIALECCEVWYISKENTIYLCSISTVFAKLAFELRENFRNVFTNKLAARRETVKQN